MRATQSSTQASSACSATRLWLKTALRLRVDAAGEEGRRHLARGAGELRGLVRQRHRVQVDHAIEAGPRLLQRDEALDRAEIIAEVEIAGRLNA